MTSQFITTALLGTSADPPTLGHKALLEGLLKLFPKVITWASDNPAKEHGLPLNKRTELLQILVKKIDHPNLKLIQDLSSPRTFKTLEKAQTMLPKESFTFVIGSDLTGQVPHWTDAKKFLTRTRLGIAPREGWPIQKKELKAIEVLGGKIQLLPLIIPASSSSNFRENHNKSHLPSEVLKKILKENLYKIATTN